MNQRLLEDRSKYGIYGKARKVGHVAALVSVVSLVWHLIRHSGSPLDSEKRFFLFFMLAAWFIIIPALLFLGDPKYEKEGTYMYSSKKFQQVLIYYVWPFVFIALFLWFAFTPWTP